MKDTDTSRETKPLNGRYAKLRDDLKIALEAGRKAASAHTRDTGTCNFDSPGIILPRWNQKLLEQAAKEAGTSCYKASGWLHSSYVFSPCVGVQGDPRCDAAETMTKTLRELGYDAHTYHQMD